MEEHHVANTVFTTKLSLPKFISLISRLTTKQKDLVWSIGLGNLLEISCDILPRGLICYIVSIFDHQSRALKLPNGPSVVLTPLLIHHVLGTPVGGMKIGEKFDEGLRNVIVNMTKCKGRFPTISELDAFITTKLEGDDFKIAFGMYAFTAFLCPSSHAAFNPDYLHVFKEPDNIGSFDISAAVLDKLVNCIETYSKGLSCVLGGNLLSLLIIYLEFRNVDLVPVRVKTKLPCISVWTSQMVIDLESMDCISWESRAYGKLPVKSFSETPFALTVGQPIIRASKSYDELLNFVLSICPKDHHKKVIDELPKIMATMEKDIVESIQPVLCDNIINVLKLLPSVHLPSQNIDDGGFQIEKAQVKVPVSSSDVEVQVQQMKLPLSPLGNQYPPFVELENYNADTKRQTSSTQSTGYVTFPGINLVVSTKDVSKHLNCTENDLEDEFPRIFVIPEPDESVTAKLDEEACSSLNLKSMIEIIDSFPLEPEIDYPSNPGLLDSMFPKKIEMSSDYEFVRTVVDLISYIHQEAASDSKVWKLMTEKVLTVDEKVEVFNDLFISRSTESSQKMKKRLSWMPRNDAEASCIALKKRARMFQCTSDMQSTSLDEANFGVSYHENVQSSGHFENVQSTGHFVFKETSENKDVFGRKFIERARSDFHTTSPLTENQVGSSIDVVQSSGYGSFQGTPDKYVNPGTNDYPWSDKVWVNELLASTDRIEKEYYAKQMNSQFPTQTLNNIRISEINPCDYSSSYSSTVVEKDVFNDIVNRIPKTAKCKTIQIVRMGSTWVEHRVFGLSMQVYGKVHSYVMDMLGKSVMVEDVEKKKLDLLKEGQWKRFFIESKVAALFQLEYEIPGKLAVHLSNRMLGFMLDTMDLVHLPLFNSGFHYLLVVNLKKHIFEILYPNRKFMLIQNEANVVVKNFKLAFKIAYKNSVINIDDMETVFQSVCSTERDGDSGVFVMKMICDYNTNRTFCFEPEHAKPIREILTYYMVAHPFNEVMPSETSKILTRHNIPHNYKTPGYFPWMHEKSESSSQDPFETILNF